MGNFFADLIICAFILGTFGIAHLFANFLRLWLTAGAQSDLTLTQIIDLDQYSKEYAWIIKLAVNCFGYSCILVPGLLIYKYTNKTNYIEKRDSGPIHKAVKFCFTGSDIERIEPTASKTPSNKAVTTDFVVLIYCFVGLMGSYLTWGVLQEKIMTQEYKGADGKLSYFKDSQFLVFANRVLAFVISGSYLFVKQQTRHRAPMYKYSFASFSNIMSAWFQYEALKFVNFPTQVLAKSCKIIPVMLMGKIVFRTKYEFYEYLTAVLISIGMVFFLTGSLDESKASSVTTITGLFLLSMYMLFDSFTSNWQGDLFKTYGMSAIQMSCGVNLFSAFFTAASLSIQGGFLASLEFSLEHPKFVFDCVVLSISSAVGQLFIFYTISVFGPVVFTIIMTLRQAMAILLSCLIYHHTISVLGIAGIIVVFLAIFLRVYCDQRHKALRRRAEANRTKLAV
ncbi:unnamed protein product [Hermetia illucens]|uniref:Adenosine 3'-phospho 5'-phosphosulfate transporter 1 n=1 Tax=Hermetia illucens TaxID=343691 RepID=A0A7R8V5C1_HERIL|nr:adenosine 3'-phospho 5'-phosphosulfate transporter 1 [Hermetia illucens]CAD7092759.1 unnamed protein product [Hermetia illucens]